MARVIRHTPSWLSSPSPGFSLFQPQPDAKGREGYSNRSNKGGAYRGPTRTIAHRNTEVFVLVGNEIRWSDLVLLKDAPPDSDQASYRASLALALALAYHQAASR